MNQTHVSSKYQVVIPKEIRRKIKIKPGQRLDVDIMGEKIILSPTKRSVKLKWPQDHLRILPDPWEGEDRVKYLEEERNSWN